MSHEITDYAATVDANFKHCGKTASITGFSNHSNPVIQAYLNSCAAVAPMAGKALGGMALGGVAAGALGALIGGLTPVVVDSIGSKSSYTRK